MLRMDQAVNFQHPVFAQSQMQLKSTPVLNRDPHCLFPFVADLVVVEPQLGQDPIENAF